MQKRTRYYVIPMTYRIITTWSDYKTDMKISKHEQERMYEIAIGEFGHEYSIACAQTVRKIVREVFDGKVEI